jgi:hypothetical protein
MFGHRDPPPPTPSVARQIAIWAALSITEPAAKALGDAVTTLKSAPTLSNVATRDIAVIRLDAYLETLIEAVQASVDAADDTRTSNEAELADTCIERYHLIDDPRFLEPLW